ncbi:MAG: SDR family NAD(P)-dependent oxidoreductase [Candidatus Aminicenantaceae bacterium]
MPANESIVDLIDLTGKVAVVTGAASGIGLASSALLAEAGAALALLDVVSEKGQEAAKSIRDASSTAAFFQCDVSKESDCRRAVEEVVTKYGRIDILFNNAGVIVRKDAVVLAEAEWDHALDVTLKGVYLMSRFVIPHMVKGGGGSIINTGSGWSLKGGPKAASYCAAKGGVLNLTRAMAIDHGPQNIRVNCVCPGDIDTPLLRDEAIQLGQPWEEFAREAADRPLGRFGTPEDVARAVLFFAGDLSPWVTGAFLVVDGGGLA